MKKKLLLFLLAAASALIGSFAVAGCYANSGGNQGSQPEAPGQSGTIWDNAGTPDANGEVSVGGFTFTLNHMTNDPFLRDLPGYCLSGCSDGMKIQWNISVPSTINNQPVTAIKEQAFTECEMESVTLPESITYLGRYAFLGCYRLKSVAIPNSVTDTGDYVFRNCTGLKSATLSENMNYIKLGTFKGCTGIESFAIPKNITGIGRQAFSGCSSLSTVEIHDGIDSIGSEAFLDCSSLSTVNIPERITNIGESTFRNCEELKCITLPNGVISIGESAFRNCKQLTSVTIPNSTTEVGPQAFAECESINEISAPALAIEHFPKENLKSVIITSGDRIAMNAFMSCKKLESVTLNDGLKIIGENAFRSCWGLKSINIPESVERIDDFAFRYCTYLTSVNIQSGEIQISSSAFENCDNIETATVPASAVSAIPNNKLKAVKIISGEIGEYAFYGYNKLEDVTIADEVTLVNRWAFRNCNNIRSATMPTHAIPFIPKNKLNKVVLTSGDKIEDGAFEYCYTLTQITIPESVTAIGDNAFRDCFKLMEIWNYSDIIIEKGSTANGSIACYALDVYTTEEPSKQYEENDFTFYYGDDCLYITGYNGDMTELTIPVDPMTFNVIYKYAFYNCKNLTSVTIPSYAQTEIYYYAFSECTGLNSVTIGEKVTTIGAYAFAGCTSLRTVHIPGSVKRIFGFTFDGCTNLQYVQINDGVTEIGAGTFQSCNNLHRILIPKSVANIGNFAFNNCTKLVSIYFYGTEADWNKIDIRDTSVLENVSKFYYVENEQDVPADGKQYWHFINDIPVYWKIKEPI